MDEEVDHGARWPAERRRRVGRTRRAAVRRRRLLVASATAVLLVVATVAVLSRDGRSTTADAEQPPAEPLRWTNPVHPADFPDPAVIRAGDRYLAFATSGPLGDIQVIRSDDLVSWQPVGDALSRRPGWAGDDPDSVWAPAVARIGGSWLLYAAFPLGGSDGTKCIGVAVADSPQGPYEPSDEAPLVCPVDDGGAIDPSVFTDGDATWLLWKVDGNCCGKAASIRSQPLSEDGRELTGTESVLLEVSEAWESDPSTDTHTLVENPEMREMQGQLVLLYSGNGWPTPSYSTGYALCDSPGGPCRKPLSFPILSTDADVVVGPGGASVVDDDRGRTWIAYHGWAPDAVGYEAGGERSLRIDRLEVVDGRVVVLGPTGSPMSLGHAELVPRRTPTPGGPED